MAGSLVQLVMSTLTIAAAPAKSPPVRKAEAMPRILRASSRAERRLLAQLSRRDPAVAGAIESEYGRILLGYLRQLLDDAGAAEEVMQQVLLEAWQRGDTFDPRRASVLTWLMTIARSRAIDLMRKRVPEPRDPAAATALLDRDSAEEDHASAVAERWQMAHLLAQLAPAHAELLRMRFQFGMSQSEIAEQVGIPLGTVKTRMVSALEQIRRLMEEGQ